MQAALPRILPGLAYRDVVLDAALTFGRSAEEDLDLLRYLRNATGHGVRLRWRLDGIPVLPLRTHVHLVPPVAGVDAASSAYADRWAAEYRYGLYYFRRGPEFVVVKDVRPGGEPARLTIDEGAEHFLAMARAQTVDELDVPAQELLDTVTAAGLLVRAGDRLLMLPYRLRHWPVPYLAI